MNINSWAGTDCGHKRQNNQDRFHIDDELQLFILADGMGGHSGGEIAADLAVQSVLESIKQFKNQIEAPQLLRFSFEEANQKIYSRAQNQSELLGMGTTLLVLLKDKDVLHFANVGDSRCYLFQSEYLWQITEDHSLINEHIRKGLLTEKEAKISRKKNIITRSVGFLDTIQADLYQRSLQHNDEFLLCSDGLYGMVNDNEICQILKQEKTQNVVDQCIQHSLKNGGEDNVTVVYLKVTR